MDPISQLLRVVETFAKARKLSESRVSTLAFNDGKRIAQVRAGADMGSRVWVRGLIWFDNNWPADAEWPAGVPRPSASVVAA